VTQSLTDKIALAILARDGSAAIRQLQAAAILAQRTGYPDAADAIIEIVEAAETALGRSKTSS
jgi:hypothetical protein